MDIAVVGAGGDIGRSIAFYLVSERLVTSNDLLQLVEAPDTPGAHVALGLASDLADAFGETVPQIDVATDPDAIAADLIIFAAGRAVPCDPGVVVTRKDLAAANAPLFDLYARTLARRGMGTELVLVVTNPVELGVEIFARHLDRTRVIGVGAYLDTIRFRNEIARDLSIRRNKVRGLVIGEHGALMLPLWSTITIQGMPPQLLKERISAISGRTPVDIPTELREIAGMAEKKQFREAMARVSELPVPARLMLRPFVTHYTGQKTPFGTAEIIRRLVHTIQSGAETITACQMRIEGDYLGLTGSIGIPVSMSASGVRPYEGVALTAKEEATFRASFETVQAFIGKYVQS